jgi:HSP20 family protein
MLDRMVEETPFRFFEPWPFDEEGVYPLALDLYETDDNLIVEASLVGIPPEDVDITLEGDRLTIKGETGQAKTHEEKGQYYYRERRLGTFRRTITLPVTVKADAAKATFEHGVLKLTLPKATDTKAKHIKIKAHSPK